VASGDSDRIFASSPVYQPNSALQIAPPNMIATGTTSTITTTKMIAPTTPGS
jgi:hypothetical protein